MKVRRNLLIAFSLLSLSVNAQRIKGSDTVLPVAQQTAERYMNQHPDARVTVTGGGTGVGISALMDNTTDIAMASRPIKFSSCRSGTSFQSCETTYPPAIGRHFPWKDHQLETSGRRRPQNSSVLP